MTYVLKAPDEFSFDKVGIKGKIFPSGPISDKTEFVLITTDEGHETSIIEHESDFNYYVLDGSGYFEIDGGKEICETGNLIVIPAGRKFKYTGKMKLLLVCNPPWREDQEEEFHES